MGQLTAPLEAAFDRLDKKLGISEAKEVARVAAEEKRRSREARRRRNRGGFYTRHTDNEARAAADEAERRYP